MKKRILSLFLALILFITPLTGCVSENEEFIAAIAESTGLSEGAVRAQFKQNEHELETMKSQLGMLGKELWAELLREWGLDNNADGSLNPSEIMDAIFAAFRSDEEEEENIPKVQPDLDPEAVITGIPIPDDEVVQTISLTTSEFHPLKGFAATMMGDQVPPESEDNSGSNNGNGYGTGKFKHNTTPKIDLKSSNSDNFTSAADAITFVMDWIGNSTEVHMLRVKLAADGRMNVEYGTAIESRYAGKTKTLQSILVDNYYSSDPLILFTSGAKADEMIRGWFGLDGDGKYSMTMNFGRAYVDDFGYRLTMEDGVLYQIPILHEDTEFKVYFKEEGKDIFDASTYLFDAADILRLTQIPMAEDEAEKVLEQLREEGLIN